MVSSRQTEPGARASEKRNSDFTKREPEIVVVRRKTSARVLINNREERKAAEPSEYTNFNALGQDDSYSEEGSEAKPYSKHSNQLHDIESEYSAEQQQQQSKLASGGVALRMSQRLKKFKNDDCSVSEAEVTITNMSAPVTPIKNSAMKKHPSMRQPCLTPVTTVVHEYVPSAIEPTRDVAEVADTDTLFKSNN